MISTDESSSLGSSVDFDLAPELTGALATLADKIERFAANNSISSTASFRLNLALDELVTNCLNYALSEVDKPEIRVRLSCTPNGVIARLEDNGAPFNPFRDAPEPNTSPSLNERPVGGLGVFFVKQFTDVASYERHGDVNRITLQINLEMT